MSFETQHKFPCQKMHKTVEILQVQFIDKVVEISEIMQSKGKCQKSRRNGNSRKFTDRIVDVPVVLKRLCQPSAQVLDQIPTTCAKDAKMHKYVNFSPQGSQTPSAKTRFTKKSREGSRRKGVPADHEAQSQVKEKRRAAAGVKALRGSFTQKKD